jgi:DNA-binding transcriptional regulator GbsR (MarR family)
LTIISVENHIFEGKIKEYEQNIVEFIIDTGKAKSADPKIQLFLAYLAVHRKLTQKQLKELTGFSFGTISKKLRDLISMGILEKKKIPNSNENVYILHPNVYQAVADTSWKEFENISEFLNNKLKELEKYEDKRGFELLSQRIKELSITFDLIQKIWNEIKFYLFPQRKD